jgi:hypothetical protein
MISNAAYNKKPNKHQQVVKERSEEMVAQFRIGVDPNFG